MDDTTTCSLTFSLTIYFVAHPTKSACVSKTGEAVFHTAFGFDTGLPIYSQDQGSTSTTGETDRQIATDTMGTKE